MDKLKAVPPLETQVSPGNRMLSAGNHPTDFFGFYLKIQVAPAGAKAASCQNPVHNGSIAFFRITVQDELIKL